MRLFVPTRTDCALVTEDPALPGAFVRHNESIEGIEFVSAPDAADIVVVFEQFSFKLWNYRDALMADPLVREFASQVFTVNYDDLGRGYLPGCYTSLTTRNFDARIHRACSYPKTYNALASSARPAANGFAHLFSFRGTVASHPVRRAIVRRLSNTPGANITPIDTPFYQHTDAQKRSYADEICQSAFVLCPRGWSPSTYRLFEVMALGRCPVIISDAWVPVRGVDWTECSLRVRESDVARIPDILAARVGDAERLGANAALAWDSVFSNESKNRHYMRSLIELWETAQSAPSVSLSELNARWRSRRFQWQNGWTVPQRLRAKVERAVQRW